MVSLLLNGNLQTCHFGQTTLGAAFSFSGRGVFMGQFCQATLHPAPADHGLVFESQGIRIQVTPTALRVNPNRSSLTSAEHPEVAINMVEHILSALHGLGIDNALITIEGGECPLNDGSARDVIAGVAAVGVMPLSAPREVLVIERSHEFTQGDATLRLGPPCTDGLSIDYTLDYAHPMIGRQRVELTVTPELYATRIGLARTFVPIEEVEQLIAAGVVQSTESDCLVIWPDRTNHPLHQPTEFADHKVLDLIGDLRLCGYPVWGHVVGVRSGHGLNQQAARWLAEVVA